MKKEHEVGSQLQECMPLISMAASAPPSTLLSNTIQSLAGTSIDVEECDANMGEMDTHYWHGGFGEDGDDSLEHEDALKARVDKRVSEAHMLPPITPLPIFFAYRSPLWS